MKQVNRANQLNQLNQMNQVNKVSQGNQTKHVNQVNQVNMVNQLKQMNQVKQLKLSINRVTSVNSSETILYNNSITSGILQIVPFQANWAVILDVLTPLLILQVCQMLCRSIVSIIHEIQIICAPPKRVIGKSIPDAQGISGRRSPREISRVEGNLEGRGDGFPNTSQLLVEYGHSPHHQSIHRDGSGNPSLRAEKG